MGHDTGFGLHQLGGKGGLDLGLCLYLPRLKPLCRAAQEDADLFGLAVGAHRLGLHHPYRWPHLADIAPMLR
jgi:hypothetical protein